MSNLLDRKRFGAVLRVFSKTPEQVAQNVAQTVEAVGAIEAFKLEGRRLFSKLLILVPVHDLYPDHDCRQTAPMLIEELGIGGSRKSRTEVHEIEFGDLFCGLPNAGAAKLARDRCDYMFLMSHGARSFLTPSVMRQLLEAHQKGAKVSGVAIPEIAESIMDGRIANTFALWEIEPLLTVGGFNLMAAQSEVQPGQKHDTKQYLRGWNEDEGHTFYSSAGVEEMLALAELVANFGECIAPIPAPSDAVWQEPDPLADPQGYRRSRIKLETKYFRQMYHLAKLGVDPNFLKGGVMEAYRTF